MVFGFRDCPNDDMEKEIFLYLIFLYAAVNAKCEFKGPWIDLHAN